MKFFDGPQRSDFCWFLLAAKLFAGLSSLHRRSRTLSQPSQHHFQLPCEARWAHWQHCLVKLHISFRIPVHFFPIHRASRVNRLLLNLLGNHSFWPKQSHAFLVADPFWEACKWKWHVELWWPLGRWHRRFPCNTGLFAFALMVFWNLIIKNTNIRMFGNRETSGAKHSPLSFKLHVGQITSIGKMIHGELFGWRFLSQRQTIPCTS